MQRPSVPPVPSGQAPQEIAELLSRDDLPVGDVQWWLKVFAACNAGLSEDLEAAGAAGMRARAEVYLTALDKARLTGGVPLPETLWRKLLVVDFAAGQFGAARGDRVRDPEGAFAEFRSEVGMTPEAVLAEYTRVTRGLREEPRDGPGYPELVRRAVWLAGVRRAMSMLGGLAAQMTDPEPKRQAARWHGLGREMK